MLDKIPLNESLKGTIKRTSVYWNTVIGPALEQGKTVLVVGHETNLRSLLVLLENISEDDVINLNLPRAIPLAYKLDESLKPVNLRADGSLDEATGFLRGSWLAGDDTVSKILERDQQQVYDTSIKRNLELGSREESSIVDFYGESWRTWMDLCSEMPAIKQHLQEISLEWAQRGHQN
jgi:hypothetical protein